MATMDFQAAPPPAPQGLELLYGVLFRPTATYQALGPDAPMATAGGVVLVVALVAAFAMAPPEPGAVGLSFFIALGWLFLSWLLLTGPLFVVSRLLGGRGELPALMAATALAFLPFVLIGPMAAFAGMGKVGVLLAASFFVGAVIWWLRLVQAAVRGCMGLTGGQAVMALVGTELLLAAVPGLYVTLWVLTLVLAIG